MAPTGAGKGTVAAHVLQSCASKGKRGLFLVHRSEIANDVRERLASLGVPAGIRSGSDTCDEHLAVQVATIQTLTAREQCPPADLIVVDEAHHVTASTYRSLLEQYPNAKILGLTATPERRDRTALGNVFDELYTVAQVPELVERGVLCPIEVYAPPDVGGVAKDPVEAYRELGNDGTGLVFLPTIKESGELAQRFCEAGIPAEHLDGNTPKRGEPPSWGGSPRAKPVLSATCLCLPKVWIFLIFPSASWFAVAVPLGCFCRWLVAFGARSQAKRAAF